MRMKGGMHFAQEDVAPQKAQKAHKRSWPSFVFFAPFVVKISWCPALLRFGSESARLRTRIVNKAVTATSANQSYSLSRSNKVGLTQFQSFPHKQN